MRKNWAVFVSGAISAMHRGHDMASANAEMIRRVVSGKGPDQSVADPGSGARTVMNIAAVHVPSVCNATYKNTYDLQRIGGKGPSKIRDEVDNALRYAHGKAKEDVYFGAVEVNGSGVRFYGDFCFVLKSEAVDADTVVLSSNSYDLAREPCTPAGQPLNQQYMTDHLKKMTGKLSADLPNMAVAKTMETRSIADRRLTTGQVSDAILEDEDYMEVLKIGSFGAGGLQEARVSAADSALELQIGERSLLGPTPSLAELHWRKHRRAAVGALRKKQVSVRVITTSGRVRA